ncbi:phytoene synthase [Corynebacterium phocae]|uniref:Phytoene synthase n=1 Tax=Corynebacterium phocae TaxID=161895 RepID=A0A1L7D1F1_9CORY|nr:phytoene/squalene synthase family protein [Corynebacterium phocae]APT91928.1 phytoene synthase [Corynebacterium phocae]KAA8727384.1 phytoene/squalene synthase family protein [Corynebacterium phocae]
MSEAVDSSPAGLPRFNRSGQRAARQLINSYSTSFSLATRLLGPRTRADITNLYAVVRIADEIVDGTAAAAGLSREDIAAELDAYESRVLAAPSKPFHTDPVLHAFAGTARRCGFREEHLRAFFASMRRDLHQTSYRTAGELEEYVYGSAEVIGLLCLDVFVADHPVPPADKARLEHGARRLGAAFQKINFLRDLHHDTHDLGRTYFPQLASGHFNAAAKDELVADIRADLSAARHAIDQLPLSARIGVAAATELFTALNNDLADLSAAEVRTRRVRVSNPRKLALVARAAVTSLRTTLT